MIGAHGADVDGLDAADASIVFQLYTCEKPQCVGHVETVQTMKLLTVELLRWDHPLLSFAKHHHFLQFVYAVCKMHMALLLCISQGDSHAQ